MVQFLDPETTKILQFLDPEIVEMDKKKSGSRNRRNPKSGETLQFLDPEIVKLDKKKSGSINHKKGQQILYLFTGHLVLIDVSL